MSSGMNGTKSRGVFASVAEMQAADLRVGTTVWVHEGSRYDIYATDQGGSLQLSNGLWAKKLTGTAAERDAMTSITDTVTPNALMVRGAFGIGGSAATTGNDNLLLDHPSGMYRIVSSNTGMSVIGGDTVIRSKYATDNNNRLLALSRLGLKPKILVKIQDNTGSWGDEEELHHTGNLGASDTAWTRVTQLENGWTGTVRYIKRGGVVSVNIGFINAENATSDNVFSLPSAYHPDYETNLVVRVGPTEFRHARITMTGILQVFERGVFTDIRGSITYPVLP